MNWIRLLEVTVVAGIASAICEYVLAGDWLHKRSSYQEIWRTPPSNWAMAIVAPLPFLTSAALAVLISRLDIHTTRSALVLAGAIWLIGPMPLILSSAVYVKLRGFFVVSFAFSWLVRLMMIAIVAEHFLS